MDIDSENEREPLTPEESLQMDAAARAALLNVDLPQAIAEWKAKGFDATPVDRAGWMPFGYIKIDGFDFMNSPTRPMKFISDWAMPNGGKLRIVRHVTQKAYEVLTRWKAGEAYDRELRFEGDRTFKIRYTGEYREGSITFQVIGNANGKYLIKGDGELDQVGDEMSDVLVVTKPSFDPDLRNEVITCLQRIVDHYEDDVSVDALRSTDGICYLCGRPLQDEISKILGVGSTCAKRIRIRHSIIHARAVEARRRELMGVAP
jgi:hypothetical protein